MLQQSYYRYSVRVQLCSQHRIPQRRHRFPAKPSGHSCKDLGSVFLASWRWHPPSCPAAGQPGGQGGRSRSHMSHRQPIARPGAQEAAVRATGDRERSVLSCSLVGGYSKKAALPGQWAPGQWAPRMHRQFPAPSLLGFTLYFGVFKSPCSDEHCCFNAEFPSKNLASLFLMMKVLF